MRMPMRFKLTSSQIIFRVGPAELDKQDLLILFGLVASVWILAIFFDLVGLPGTSVLVPGLFLASFAFRGVLIAKKHLKSKK